MSIIDFSITSLSNFVDHIGKCYNPASRANYQELGKCHTAFDFRRLSHNWFWLRKKLLLLRFIALFVFFFLAFLDCWTASIIQKRDCQELVLPIHAIHIWAGTMDLPDKGFSSVTNAQVKQPRQETWPLRLQQFSRSGCVHYWLCSFQSRQLMFTPFGRKAHPIIKIFNKFNGWFNWPFSASVS